MMTNLLHGAHVANKLFSTIARLRLLLVMFLTLTVTTNAWGADETATFIASSYGWNDAEKTGDPTTKTVDDITFEFAGGSTEPTYYDANGLRTYEGCEITISSEATISSIAFTYTISNSGSLSATPGTWNSSTKKWSGSANTVTFTVGHSSGSKNGQIRITQIAVTYTAAASDPYTVTLVPGSGTCDDESLTETSGGAGVTLPIATPSATCQSEGWTFAGWAEASVATETEEAPTTLYEAGDTYKPKSNITLYAVYQRTETTQGGGSSEETVDFSSQGYANQQEVSSYNGTNFSVAFDKGNNSNTPKYYTSGTAIRIYGGGYFTVSSETTITKIVLGFGSSDGSNEITTNVNTYSDGTWTGSANSVKFTIGGSSGNRRIASLTVTTSGGGSTTYYHSTPDCGSAEPTHYLLRK